MTSSAIRNTAVKEKTEGIISEYLSIKLKCFSFIAIVMVVFLHAGNLMASFPQQLLENINVSSFTMRIVSEELTRIAVPLFFTMSGFLFFATLTPNITAIKLKYKRRFKTLVIPYLFWSVYSLALYFTIQLAPETHVFFNQALIWNFSSLKLLDIIFLNPLAYQLWFLRDLIVLIAFTPLLQFLFKKIGWILLLIAGGIWLLNLQLIVIFGSSLFFFSMGAFFAIYRKKTPKFRLDFALFLVILWIAGCCINTLNRFNNVEFKYISLFNSFNIFLGLAGVWLFYDGLMEEKTINDWWKSLFSFSFFLYAFHEPFITIIKKVLVFLLPHDSSSLLFIYLLSALFTIFVSIIIGVVLKKRLPSLYNQITGGR